MFTPKQYQFTKVYKNVAANQKPTFVYSNGIFCGLVALTYGTLTVRRYELMRRFLTKGLGRKRKVYHKVGLLRPLTAKSTKSRMGKGIGELKLWYAYVRPGLILFEIKLRNATDRQALRMDSLNKKLPFVCKLCVFRYTFKFSQLRKLPLQLTPMDI